MFKMEALRKETLSSSTLHRSLFTGSEPVSLMLTPKKCWILVSLVISTLYLRIYACESFTVVFGNVGKFYDH